MITEYQGNLLDCPALIIGHIANAQCVFGCGVAKEIRLKYPRAYQSDISTGKDNVKKLADFSLALRNEDQRQTVCNIYAMRYWGRERRQLNYEYLYLGLSKVRDWIIKMNIQDEKLGLPYKLGCNNAGGDFRIVRPMIDVIFENSGIDVLICKI